jgi:hypothetical protein
VRKSEETGPHGRGLKGKEKKEIAAALKGILIKNMMSDEK